MYQLKKSNMFHFLSVIFLVVGIILIGIPVGIMVSLGMEISDTYIAAATQLFAVFLPVVVYYLSQKGSLKNSLYIKSPGLVNSILAIILTWVLLPTVGLLNYISMFFVKNHIADSLEKAKSVPFLLAIVIIAVFPAVFEELSTRLILADNYRYKPYYLACIMSGLFFGMLHLNINQFIYTFLLGMVLCFIVQVTGSIFTAMIMHFTLNASSVTLNYYFAESAASSPTPNVPELLGIMGVNIITIPLAAFIIWFIIRYNGKLAILKQKPTTLELTLGKKFAPYTPVPMESVAQNGWYQPNQALVGPESYEIYMAKNSRTFTWPFWATVVFFIAFAMLTEAMTKAVQSLPQ